MNFSGSDSLSCVEFFILFLIFWIFLEMVSPTIAACPLPRPGNKLSIGDATNEPMNALATDFPTLSKSNFLGPTSCSGTFTFVFMLSISIDDPKRPVSRGSNGSFISRFRTLNPRRPESVNAINARLFFFSKEISSIEIKIRNKTRTENETSGISGITSGIFVRRRAWIFGITIVDGNVIRIKIKIASRPP